MSLEAILRVSESLTIKVECKDVENLFQEVSPLQEVLLNNKCGACGSTKTRLVHRKIEGKHDVYEIACLGINDQNFPCGRKLHLGKGQNLFPRRYEQDPDDPKKPRLDKEGKKIWLPNNGWVRWDAKQEKYV